MTDTQVTWLTQEAYDRLASLLKYVKGDYRDPSSYEALKAALDGAQCPTHYLAVPPSLFVTVVQNLGHSSCATNARVVVEKPFGRDLESARELNRAVLAVFPEESIYRMDHYLGKEAVQNLLYLRFANSIFEPIWNRDHVRSVQLTMADIKANAPTVDNVRLWERDLLMQTFKQLQEIRTYYDFVSVHNDRYVINGDYRQIMISARELNSASLPNRTWINERLTFTHGYGITLGPVNQVTAEGLPVLFIKNLPVAGATLDAPRR